jgi:hypothetical protein
LFDDEDLGPENTRPLFQVIEELGRLPGNIKRFEKTKISRLAREVKIPSKLKTLLQIKYNETNRRRAREKLELKKRFLRYYLRRLRYADADNHNSIAAWQESFCQKCWIKWLGFKKMTRSQPIIREWARETLVFCWRILKKESLPCTSWSLFNLLGSSKFDRLRPRKCDEVLGAKETSLEGGSEGITVKPPLPPEGIKENIIKKYTPGLGCVRLNLKKKAFALTRELVQISNSSDRFPKIGQFLRTQVQPAHKRPRQVASRKLCLTSELFGKYIFGFVYDALIDGFSEDNIVEAFKGGLAKGEEHAEDFKMDIIYWKIFNTIKIHSTKSLNPKGSGVWHQSVSKPWKLELL